MRLSQSFFKDFYRPLCGLVLKSKYIDHSYPEQSSEAMNQGKFFEYQATDYIRKGDEPPFPSYYVKSGVGYKEGDMKPEYQQAAKHAKMFKEVLKQFTNPNFGVDLRFGSFAGIADVVVDGAIIDLKYSGLLYDRWNEHGWAIEKFKYAYEALQTEDLLTVLKKVPLLWQPLLYCWLWYKMCGQYPRWFFYIADPKSDDVIFRELAISASTHSAFDALLPQLEAEINLIINTSGFQPLPSYNACNSCAIAEGCQHRILLPQIETVTL